MMRRVKIWLTAFHIEVTRYWGQPHTLKHKHHWRWWRWRLRGCMFTPFIFRDACKQNLIIWEFSPNVEHTDTHTYTFFVFCSKCLCSAVQIANLIAGISEKFAAHIVVSLAGWVTVISALDHIEPWEWSSKEYVMCNVCVEIVQEYWQCGTG